MVISAPWRHDAEVLLSQGAQGKSFRLEDQPDLALDQSTQEGMPKCPDGTVSQVLQLTPVVPKALAEQEAASDKV